MCTARPNCPGCSLRVRSLGPECTAPTGWRPTACWRVWSSGAGGQGRGRPRGGFRAGARRNGEPVGRAALVRSDLQRAMSRDASVVRDADGLHGLIDTLSAAPLAAVVTRAGLEDAALTATARALAAAALAREESRGCHHRAEYLDAAGTPARSLVVRLAADYSAEVETLAAVC